MKDQRPLRLRLAEPGVVDRMPPHRLCVVQVLGGVFAHRDEEVEALDSRINIVKPEHDSGSTAQDQRESCVRVEEYLRDPVRVEVSVSIRGVKNIDRVGDNACGDGGACVSQLRAQSAQDWIVQLSAVRLTEYGPVARHVPE